MHPESGTRTYGYVPNRSLLAWKTDAKNQRIEYSYDPLGRLSTAATTSSAWGLSSTYDGDL